MSRYIDVNEFYEKMYEWVRMHGGIIRNEMQAILETVPSIDIVRCGECKHREEYPCKVYHDDDWYCADGERTCDGR